MNEPTGTTAVALVEQAAAQSIQLPAIAAERGIDGAQWSALKNSVFRGASDQMVCVAMDYCKARQLDPLKKPVHIVGVWDNQARKMVETIWEGIASLRTTAMRTGEYAGRDASEFGPDVTEQWEGGPAIRFPEWCQVTVYRMIHGAKCAFPGPRVYWLETYASKKGGAPNAMWTKRPRGQLDKCAEAAALRAAFPEEIGGQQSAEEMDGQTVDGPAIGPDAAVDITPAADAGIGTGSTKLDDFAGPTIDGDTGEMKIPESLDRRGEAEAATPAETETPDEKPATTFGLTNPETGELKEYERAGAWLTALEKMLNETTSPESAGVVWDANREAYSDINTRTQKNPKAVAKCKEVGDLAARLMNPPADDATAETEAADGSGDDLY